MRPYFVRMRTAKETVAQTRRNKQGVSASNTGPAIITECSRGTLQSFAFCQIDDYWRQEESASDRARREQCDTLTQELKSAKDATRRQEVGARLPSHRLCLCIRDFGRCCRCYIVR